MVLNNLIFLGIEKRAELVPVSPREPPLEMGMAAFCQRLLCEVSDRFLPVGAVLTLVMLAGSKTDCFSYRGWKIEFCGDSPCSLFCAV